jgi:hypothetical protein
MAGHDDEDRDARGAVVEVRADEPGEAYDDQRLDRDREHAVGHAPEIERAAPDGRDEEAVHDAAIHVVNERDAVPAGRGDRGHHDHARREVVGVAATGEPGDLDDALEERAEEQQPDDRLDERDRNPGGLPDYRGPRDWAGTKALNPELQTFEEWLAANISRVPVS